MKKHILLQPSLLWGYRKAFLATLMLYAILITSCKKESSTLPAESAPVTQTFFVNTPVSISAVGSGNYEYGFKFSVSQKGKITKLASRMPQAGSYRITLWDAGATPEAIITSANINQAAGALTFQNITPISVETGKDYFISVWSSGQWYEIRPSGGSNFVYPINTGNIIIKGYQWVGSAATPQKFPTNTATSYVAGLADFEFQPE